jgi:hypothetical protein
LTRTFACELPVDRDRLSLTDWVEAMMIVERQSECSDAELRGRLVEQGDQDGGADEAPGQRMVEDVLREVERRARFAPRSYPFRRNEFGVKLANPRLIRIYSFLLCLSILNVPFRSKVYTNAVTPLFDHLGIAALTALLGPQAVSIRFGWPVSGGRPKNARKALVWLAERMNLSHDEQAAVSASAKDCGVDAVIWRPFRDDRPGFPLLLAQCTVGQSEWTKKGGDIKPTLWREYLRLKRDPATALVLPFCVPQPDRFEGWALTSHDVSFIVDRLRLLELLERVDSSRVEAYARLSSWTKDREKDLVLS